MKKILLMLIAILSVMTLHAQPAALMQPKFTDNTFISVEGGAFNGVNPWKWDNVEGMAGLKIGKWLTPVFGTELDGEVGFANYTTFVDHTNVTWNVMMNMNNLIHGYKGKADKVEVVPFSGIGWFHTYGSNFHMNALSWKGGISLDWNVDKAQAWQINLRPSITYILASDYSPLGFNSKKAYLTVAVGVTYKFKNSFGTHNFVKCDKVYTQAEWDALNAELNATRSQARALNARIAELEAMIQDLLAENASLKAVLGTAVVKNEEKEVAVTPVVGFTIGSAKIAETQLANIEATANVLKDTNKKITILGYADKNTGSTQFNQQLSINRANAVAQILIENGVNADNITVVGRGSAEQPFATNNLNRAAFITVE